MNSSFEYLLITQLIRGIGCGLGLSPAITWAMSVVAGDVEDGTAINNTARQVIGAIGSSVTVVIMQILASGNITHNQLSVNTACNEKYCNSNYSISNRHQWVAAYIRIYKTDRNGLFPQYPICVKEFALRNHWRRQERWLQNI